MNPKGFGQAISELEFAALKKGKHSGFNAAYQTYADHVYSLSLHIIGQEHTAADILQTVFETLLKKSSSLRGVDTLGGWLKQSTINACMGHFRKTKQDKVHFENQVTLMKESFEENEDDIISPETSKETLATDLLDRLPLMQRSIVYAYAVQELKHKELAATLDINEVNSRQMYRRAIKQLKTWLNIAR